ncbi:MAG: 3'-5' exonuclease [Prevotellaceae bacterium]|jgi:DNA polymerase elongation subunit (family B)|nr:3'-5' exonuclease [Prevotellaceae bacterium]
MLDLQLDKILFLDIETVPQTAEFAQLPAELAQLWEEKAQMLQQRNPERYSAEQTAEDMFASAGIYAEFGKVVCISVGFVHYNRDKEMCLRTKSFCGDDERELLIEFSDLLRKNNYMLCGHNIKEFDVPYLCRRMLVNGLPLPPVLRIAGKKPWEVQFLDTLELWKFGDYKNYTSLKLLTAIFGIPTPKDDIDGSQVAGVYYNDHDLRRIAVYCEKDVTATAQLLLRMCGKNLIEEKNIASANG